MEVAIALRALGGTARWKTLRGHVSWRALKRARAAGTILCSGGFYSLPDTESDRVLAGQLRGVRSHETAAAHWGFALPPGNDTVHLTVAPNGHRTDVPVNVRLSYRLLADDERTGDVTSPVRTVVDCLRDGSLRVALSVGDSALRSGVITWDQLARAVASLQNRGSALARARMAMLDARSANAFESSARAVLLGAGITGFESQVSIRHHGDWVGRVDLADRRRRIVVECDGYEFHNDRATFVKDLVRFTMLVAGGWRPLRFTWEQVMFREEWVLARVSDVVRLTSASAEDSPRPVGSRAAA
jgi:very-short-patch-repair endonuclease